MNFDSQYAIDLIERGLCDTRAALDRPAATSK